MALGDAARLPAREELLRRGHGEQPAQRGEAAGPAGLGVRVQPSGARRAVDRVLEDITYFYGVSGDEALGVSAHDVAKNLPITVLHGVDQRVGGTACSGRRMP